MSDRSMGEMSDRDALVREERGGEPLAERRRKEPAHIHPGTLADAWGKFNAALEALIEKAEQGDEAVKALLVSKTDFIDTIQDVWHNVAVQYEYKGNDPNVKAGDVIRDEIAAYQRIAGSETVPDRLQILQKFSTRVGTDWNLLNRRQAEDPESVLRDMLATAQDLPTGLADRMRESAESSK